MFPRNRTDDSTGRRSRHISYFIAGSAILIGLTFGATLPGQSRRYIAAGTTLHQIDGATITTLFSRGRGIYGATMDADNRHVLFTLTSSSTSLNAGLYRLDPSTASLATVFDNPQHIPYDVTLTADGDYLFTGLYSTSSTLRPSSYGVFRYAPGAGITTVATAAALGGSPLLRAGLAVDIDTGSYIVPDGSSGPAGRRIWRVGADGSIGTFGTSSDNGYSVVQDIPSGDIIVGGYTNCYRLRRGSSTSTSLWSSYTGAYFYALDMNEASARPRQFVSVYSSQQYRVTLGTNALTTLTLGGFPGVQFEVIRYGARNLQSVRIGTRVWDYYLDVPNAAGKGYAVALGISGVRPGIPLGDGRWVQLYPDSVTVGTLAGTFNAIFRNATGFLNANGRGVATLDLSRFPRTAGLRVWAIAVVLDPAAPKGVATITDPTVLVVR